MESPKYKAEVPTTSHDVQSLMCFCWKENRKVYLLTNMHNLLQQSLCGPRRECIRLFWTESYNKIVYIQVTSLLPWSCCPSAYWTWNSAMSRKKNNSHYHLVWVYKDIISKVRGGTDIFNMTSKKGYIHSLLNNNGQSTGLQVKHYSAWFSEPELNL
jgi:hypothetical protein